MDSKSVRHVVVYVRVSTRDQDLSLQAEKIQKYIMDSDFIQEVESGMLRGKMPGSSG